MRKRTGYTLLAVLLVLFALAAVLVVREKAPPEAARLLPESDAIVFFNLKPLRAATHFDRSPVPPTASYQEFIQATGIVAERDLDQAAFALHQMADPHGPNGPVAFSEVFTGHFSSTRLEHYLGTLASGKESYASHVIYLIPSEARTLRVTILDYETVAASNAPTPEQIHAMIDRSRFEASPFAGSSLLNRRYGEVPPFSSAWAIGRIGLPFTSAATGAQGEPAEVTLAGLELPIPADATFVASLRYTSALNLRVDELAGSEGAAAQSAHSLGRLLDVFRTLESSQGGPPDPAFARMLSSMTVEAHKDRTTLTATIPPEVLSRFRSAAH